MAEATDDRLRLFVERIERIDEEIAGLQEDRRDVYAEAKAVGYDPAIIRAAVKRRKVAPDVRAEFDQLLETYEAALGGADVEIPDRREDLQALAEQMLAEQLARLEDPQAASDLVEHVTVLLDLRARVADLRRQEAARKKLAKGEGFEPGALGKVVQWIEKCLKHGRPAMRAGEATVQLYRGTVEAAAGVALPSTEDSKLQALGLGGNAPTGAKAKARDATEAWLTTGMG